MPTGVECNYVWNSPASGGRHGKYRHRCVDSLAVNDIIIIIENMLVYAGRKIIIPMPRIRMAPQYREAVEFLSGRTAC